MHLGSRVMNTGVIDSFVLQCASDCLNISFTIIHKNNFLGVNLNLFKKSTQYLSLIAFCAIPKKDASVIRWVVFTKRTQIIKGNRGGPQLSKVKSETS